MATHDSQARPPSPAHRPPAPTFGLWTPANVNFLPSLEQTASQQALQITTVRKVIIKQRCILPGPGAGGWASYSLCKAETVSLEVL